MCSLFLILLLTMPIESAEKQSKEIGPIISELECFMVGCRRAFRQVSTWSEVEVHVDVRATNLS